MVKRFWNSPTLMTWLSYSTKTLTLFGVLPLVLKRFQPGDVVLWYLFSTVISLQSLADFGFRQTFSRMISYAFGGAKEIDTFIPKDKSGDKIELPPNRELLNVIISTMKQIYVWLTLSVTVLMVLFGTWSMIKPVKDSTNITQAWWSWSIVVLVSCINFYGKLYLNFLEGLNKIALVRRIETFTSLGSIISSIIVLFISPSLLNLVIINQVWVLVVTVRDWYLCITTNGGLYKEVSKRLPFDLVIFKKIWKPAWRSGISGFMSIGLTNLTGLIYAQVGTSAAVAAYLLALRIINQVREVSMAPFYSKIPLLAMLRVKGDLQELIKVVKRGMFLSHFVFVTGFVLVGLFSDSLLKAMHSEVHFVSPLLWSLLGFAYFVHRYGAMHMQVYLSTNHVISHIADGISGILFIVSAVLLSKIIGVYSVPIGMLIGYLGFYSWYAAIYSFRSLKVGFWSFEKSVSLIPVLVFSLYIILSFYKIAI